MFLRFEGIENARDLGGLARQDGARIRSGLLLRTGRLEQATDGDVRRLADLGLRTVVDFRDDGELVRAPDRKVPGAAYHHLRALPDLSQNFKPVDDPGYTAQGVHDDFRRIYRFLATSTEALTAYTEFFRLLLSPDGAPVLFHCTQGKDRTGIAAALVMAALGFDEPAIEREYLLTNEYMQRTLDAFAQMERPPFPMDMAREIFLVFPENLKYYVNCIEIGYGTVSNFLELALNVGPKEIKTLEDIYLE